MKNKETIIIVKFKSSGVAEAPYNKYQCIYTRYAIIINGKDNIDETIEKYRKMEQAQFQKVNTCEVRTTVISKEKILVNQILISSKK